MLIHRDITAALHDYRNWFPVVYLGGPRQSGKTTLLKHMYPDLPYTNLEDADTRLRAEEDPRRFLNAFPNGAIIDEAQRVPVLFNYLQGYVDADPKHRFILSGSQNFLLMESITQSLAGRVGLLSLLPLSDIELAKQGLTQSLEDFTWQGGYPSIYGSHKVPTEVFFDNYIQTYIERDVRMLKQVGNLSTFAKFMRLCAGRVGQPLNISTLAADTGVAPNTIKDWLSILEASYLIFKLQPFFENYNKRIIKSYKIYFFDTGLLCNLLGIHSPAQLEQHHNFGTIIENAVIVELQKKYLNKGKRPKFWFWQDQQHNEIDLIIEDEGKLKAVEIKSSQTYNSRLTTGLKRWQTVANSSPDKQYLVYAGQDEAMLEHGLLLPWRKAIDIL